jgi:hypothetical protein
MARNTKRHMLCAAGKDMARITMRHMLCVRGAQIRQIYREEKKRDEDSTRLMFEK